MTRGFRPTDWGWGDDHDDQRRFQEDVVDEVEVACTIVAETLKAIKINDGDTDCWIPKSQLMGRSDKSITIPEWLATEKGPCSQKNVTRRFQNG